MSTRATYTIIEDHVTTTFYIHHDGYPSGAALYFKAMLEYRCEAPNAGMADRFMRANPRAELTENHEAHGDTDYQYTFKTNEFEDVLFYKGGFVTENRTAKLENFIQDFITNDEG